MAVQKERKKEKKEKKERKERKERKRRKKIRELEGKREKFKGNLKERDNNIDSLGKNCSIWGFSKIMRFFGKRPK